MQKDQFYPERTMGNQTYDQFKAQYEGVKASHEADLSTIENCLGKCNVNFKGDQFDQRENTCLRKCFIKYLDSALLIEKEMLHYVHGQNV